MSLPAYGRDLVALQRSGRNVQWLIISLSFALGRALPRVVIPDDAHIGALDLNCVAGLDCLVAHEGNERRALDVAELALKCGATRCVTHDQNTGTGFTTDEIRAIRGLQ